MRAGWAARRDAQLDSADRKVCGCGHPEGAHRELRPEHPDYKPWHFHCDRRDCLCVITTD